MNLTPKQIEGLALMLHAARPEWPLAPLRAIIEKNREVPSYQAVVIAAITKATEPSCMTPAPIFTPGPHWPEEARTKIHAPDCPDHIGKPAHNCAGCWADVKAGDRLPQQVGKPLNPEPGTNPTARYLELMKRAAGVDLSDQKDAA